MDDMILCFVNAPIKVNNSYNELQKDIFEVVSGNIHQVTITINIIILYGISCGCIYQNTYKDLEVNIMYMREF